MFLEHFVPMRTASQFYGPRDGLRARPQTRRPNMRRNGDANTPRSARRERPSNMSTPPDDLSLKRLQGDDEQVLKPVRATSRRPPRKTAKLR